jgi:phosphoglucosamine mutase
MARSWFGTDGIRGRVGSTPMTPDFVLKLGHAVGNVLAAGGQGAAPGPGEAAQRRPRVVIGKDTRLSGYMLESALESGFNSAGVDVTLLGPLPTPGVAFLTRDLQADLGVVISASHNPYPDNGIKFFSAQGSKLPDAWEQQVEQALSTQQPAWKSADAIGRTRRLDDAAARYIDFCVRQAGKDLSLEGLKIVVDAAHGAAYQIAPRVFEALGAEVVAIGCEPDGLNINEGCGATHPERLQAEVRARRAQFGIALDGDADRVQMVDGDGRLYNGDELLYVLACDRLARGQALGGVVGTLMTNLAIERALRAKGLDFVRAKVGDRYVLEELERRGWLIGGEGSGHLLALDCHSTGDGLISALLVLRACVRSGRSLADALEGVALYPQTLINVELQPGQDWKASTTLAAEHEAVLRDLADCGRVLIRPSGTEPKLRVMVEAMQSDLARTSAERLVRALRAG